ncbi:hypothetical protein [Streptomyces anulatus]|uniref:hypothetical protein n=1 Tax=Streptomyces anulatus TaxID=1892 RepID=UPI003F4D0963
MELLEAYPRRETAAYPAPWHDRLKTAYVDALADRGVSKDLAEAQPAHHLRHPGRAR